MCNMRAILVIVLLTCACDASHRNDAPQHSDVSQRNDVTQPRNDASKRMYSGEPVLYHRPRFQERVRPQVPERRSKPFGYTDCAAWCSTYCDHTIVVKDPNPNECACKPIY